MKHIDKYRAWILEDLEGSLDGVRKKELSEAYQKYPQLKEIREEILQLQKQLDTQDHVYSPFFSAKVIEKINHSQRQARGEEKFSLGFKWITVPAMALALGLILFSFIKEDKLDFDTLAGTSDVYVENVMIADWSN